MDLAVLACTFADPDYYQPLHRYRDPSPRFEPAGLPAGWRRSDLDIWTVWQPPAVTLPEQGWKIHVSAQLSRAQPVLDVVAAVCATHGVPFKHLATEFMFLYNHHKHAARSQAGKFCALYPPDQPAAQRLLDQLIGRLPGEEGPYILSDRRYRDSRTVHYRFGGFRSRSRTRPDGSLQRLLHNGSGALVEDVRGIRFVLPDGISDPFADASPAPAAQSRGGDGIRIGDYRVVGVLAHSNAGGAYRALDRDGRAVFLKEARAHNGLHWDRSTAQQRLRREYEVLCDLHRQAPGLAPAPIGYFREWEHEFLVTELVPGSSVFRYAARQNPYVQAHDPAGIARYHQTCRDLLDQLGAALDRLHRLGYRFGDVNPRNLLLTEDGRLRLIDFEACSRLDEPPIPIGAPGFVPERLADWAGTAVDDYGRSAIALTLLLPIHQYAARHPAGLAHLHADASRRAPVPDDLWTLATRNFPAADRPDQAALPDPGELAADPVPHLRRLMAGLGRELAATAAPDDPDRIWPTIPVGYATNPWCVAYGAAGVVHALHHAGLPVDPAVTDRLRREALAGRDELPPGLHVGTAGIGWVLAEQGLLAEAVDLVAGAGSHPAAAGSASWSAGTAGIGTAYLALHRYTGDGDQLARAARIGEALCSVAELTDQLGPRNPIGLLHGRAGIALFLHHLWGATGERRFLRRGTALLHAELDRATEMPGGTLGFRDDDVVQRVMVYLAIGAAGIGHVLTRYVASGAADERLAAALPRVFGYADTCLTVEPGLYLGLAGIGFAHADHADHAGAGDPASRQRALRAAAGLVKYAAPGPDGRVRFLGAAGLRFSTELWSGAAGILLALDRILNGPNGQLFTLEEAPDSLNRTATGAPPRHRSTSAGAT